MRRKRNSSASVVRYLTASSSGWEGREGTEGTEGREVIFFTTQYSTEGPFCSPLVCVCVCMCVFVCVCVCVCALVCVTRPHNYVIVPTSFLPSNALLPLGIQGKNCNQKHFKATLLSTTF